MADSGDSSTSTPFTTPQPTQTGTRSSSDDDEPVNETDERNTLSDRPKARPQQAVEDGDDSDIPFPSDFEDSPMDEVGSQSERQEQNGEAVDPQALIEAELTRICESVRELLSGAQQKLKDQGLGAVDVCGSIQLNIGDPKRHGYKIGVSQNAAAAPSTPEVRWKADDLAAPVGIALGGSRIQLTSRKMLPWEPRTSHTLGRVSDETSLERDVGSRRASPSLPRPAKRKRLGQEPDSGEPSASAAELRGLMADLRDDIQEDTAECIHHIQHWLKRWRDQSRDRDSWFYEYALSQKEDAETNKAWIEEKLIDFRKSALQEPPAFPSDDIEENGEPRTKPRSIEEEFQKLSQQIRWVEECRRIADDAHTTREERWRTTSATFHDGNRQEREKFERWMTEETGRQGVLIGELVREVKGLYPLLHSLKWESPATVYQPQQPAPPPFPTQVRGGGSTRGQPR